MIHFLATVVPAINNEPLTVLGDPLLLRELCGDDKHVAEVCFIGGRDIVHSRNDLVRDNEYVRRGLH